MRYRAQHEGRDVDVEVADTGLRFGVRELAYVDIDEVVVDGWTLRLRGPHGEVALGQLGRLRDDLLADLRRARLPVRRAALLQAGTHTPIADFDATHAGQPVLVGVHADGLTVDADQGAPVYVPLSLVTDVRRAGHQLTVVARGLPPVGLRDLGRRTDEFLRDVEVARRELAARTRAAYAELDPALAGHTAPDGWAVAAGEAGAAWTPLRAAFDRTDRAAEVGVLAAAAGPALRLGLKAGFAGGTLPFVLAPVGGRVAVEGAGSEARATFVFAAGDVDRLNVALLLTGFRREALSLPEAQLGRWAVAVRMLPVVRWARQALVARVVHDAQWEPQLRAALTAAS